MKGVQFVFDEKGQRTGVFIDLKRCRDFWDDLFDSALARERRDEPRESLDEVKRRLQRKGKLPA
jgi:hypothetical protein